MRLWSRWEKILFPDTGILRHLCVSLKCFVFLCSSLWTGPCQTCCSCEYVAVLVQCHVRHSHVVIGDRHIFVYIRKLGEIELAFKQMHVLFMLFFSIYAVWGTIFFFFKVSTVLSFMQFHILSKSHCNFLPLNVLMSDSEREEILKLQWMRPNFSFPSNQQTWQESMWQAKQDTFWSCLLRFREEVARCILSSQCFASSNSLHLYLWNLEWIVFSFDLENRTDLYF